VSRLDDIAARLDAADCGPDSEFAAGRAVLLACQDLDPISLFTLYAPDDIAHLLCIVREQALRIELLESIGRRIVENEAKDSPEFFRALRELREALK
jgi:hypothetical protein